MKAQRIFRVLLPVERLFGWRDAFVLFTLAAVLWIGASLAASAPHVIHGPEITLSPAALPYYALLSLRRVIAAYILSLLFTLVYGRLAAYNRSAERVLLPLLDVLQSVPILSFLPVVLLALAAFLPERLAAELASVVLIFTSQVWNLTFAWYQALTTVPGDLREASAVFGFGGWLRFRTLELPFAANSLIWNSVMSFAGGWFFLMAAEMFSVSGRDFRLPGLGSYLQQAAHRGDTAALCWGLGTLVLIIVALDQLLWRPLIAWADRFRLDTVAGADTPSSWFYDIISRSQIGRWFFHSLLGGLEERVDRLLIRRALQPAKAAAARSGRLPLQAATLIIALGIAYAALRALHMLSTVSPAQWQSVAVGLGATLGRVGLALVLALAWTIPVGVAIGTSPRIAAWLQPLVQIAASVPATALFPALLLLLLRVPGGINIAAVVLMLLGTQWYLLFNVIAGASAIPQDLKHTVALIGLSRADRWRTLVLPALLPYIITGAITASGGAWNASIVAEYVVFGGKRISTTGVGALISHATEGGDYALLLAATLSMVLTVVTINRLLWRRLYRLAETRYKLE